MNTDIGLAVSFPDHRKHQKLQRNLEPGAMLCFIDLQSVAAMNKPDGVLIGMDVEDCCYLLHDWQEYNSFPTTSKFELHEIAFDRRGTTKVIPDIEEMNLQVAQFAG